MSIPMDGKLRIKRLNGANGAFCVGDLETEIGEFRVKDAVLDQFDEGLYTGRFWIRQIFPWSYASHGRLVMEVRAKLEDMQIDVEEQKGHVAPESPTEPDPAFEKPAAAPDPAPAKPPRSATRSAAVATVSASIAENDANPDRELFGEEIHALLLKAEPVKLDPTIDRVQFRSQRERLRKGLDYEFVSQTQTWYPPGHPMREVKTQPR